MFETTIAGSLPKPAWLAEPETLWATWKFEGEALDRAKEDAALLWLKELEDAGVDIVSDGEQFRVHFVHGLLETLEGIDWNRKTQMGIRDNRYVVDVPTVTGPLRRPRPVHASWRPSASTSSSSTSPPSMYSWTTSTNGGSMRSIAPPKA